MNDIVLLESNFVGSGLNSEVYSLNLLNCNLVVKCFKNEYSAKKEINILKKLK